MVINGVVNDNLATMSFNEHHYVVKRVTMSFKKSYNEFSYIILFRT